MFIQAKRKNEIFNVRIDEADLPLVSAISWFVTDRGYVRSSTGKPRVLLHRYLLSPADGVVVDHINGDKLDNRRCNLRLATHAENMRNRKLSQAGSKGVVWRATVGKWEASIKVDKKSIYLGRYDDKLLAIAAYDSAAKHFHAGYAKTNLDGVQSLEQSQAARAKRKVSSSGFIGVAKDKRANSFRAEVKHAGGVWRESFADPVEAAKARDKKAIELQGPGAKLNFKSIGEAD